MGSSTIPLLPSIGTFMPSRIAPSASTVTQARPVKGERTTSFAFAPTLWSSFDSNCVGRASVPGSTTSSELSSRTGTSSSPFPPKTSVALTRLSPGADPIATKRPVLFIGTSTEPGTAIATFATELNCGELRYRKTNGATFSFATLVEMWKISTSALPEKLAGCNSRSKACTSTFTVRFSPGFVTSASVTRAPSSTGCSITVGDRMALGWMLWPSSDVTVTRHAMKKREPCAAFGTSDVIITVPSRSSRASPSFAALSLSGGEFSDAWSSRRNPSPAS